MSARASRTKTKAKEATHAPAPAAAAAAAAPAAAKRSTRRKRGDDDDDDQHAATTAESTAPAQPEAKRARRGTATAAASAATTARPTRGAKRGGRSASPAPTSAAAAAAASAADDNDVGMPDDEKTNNGAEEEDDESDSGDKADPASGLDALRSALVGHMFLAPCATLRRLACPLIIAHCILDCLTVREIVTTQAVVCKAWYASAVEYGARVQQTTIKRAHDAAAAFSASSASSSSSSSAAAAAASFSSPNAVTIGSRSDQSTFLTVKSVTAMIASRLRGCVTSILVETIYKWNAATGKVGLTTALINRLGAALPHLARLECGVCAPTTTPDFNFPPNLRSLIVECEFKRAQHMSKAKREARTGPVSHSWTPRGCDEFVSTVMAAVGRCGSSLEHFGFGMNLPHMVEATGAWFVPLAQLPRLQSVALIGALKDGYSKFALLAVPALRQCKGLRSFTAGSHQSAAVAQSLLASPHDFTSFESFAFSDSSAGEGFTLTNEHVPGLKSVQSSLTALTPTHWNVKAIDWIVGCRRLVKLRLSDTHMSFARFASAAPAAPPPQTLDLDLALSVVVQLPCLMSLTLQFAALSNVQLSSALEGLPVLSELSVDSKAVTTLECFSAHKHLASTLKSLKICLPAVPRDSVSHLLSLSELTSLNIAGSFSEPLYAKQLFPFLPPYPKQPLHWLRSFVPRSAKEPVPTPPVDLVARAAAYADFDARVRAGEVRAAELLNSAQLSGVMQFLAVREFSFAGRTCRSWRAAASLPSAWSMKRTATEAEILYDRSPALGAQLYPVGSAAWATAPETVFAATGRILTISTSAPECASTVLPQLPLYRNARGLLVCIQANSPHLGFGGWYSVQSIQDADRTALTRALAAVALLPRLEALSINLDQFAPASSLAFFTAVGPQLKRAVITALPFAAYQSLTVLEELEVAWTQRSLSVTRCPGKELMACTRLRKLTLSGEMWNADLGGAVRALSADHALREVNLSLTLTSSYSRDPQLLTDTTYSRTFVSSFLRTIAGRDQSEAAAASSPLSSAAHALSASNTVLGLDDDEPAPASASSAPALLETLRLVVQLDSAHVNAGFPAEDLFALPKLKTLAIHSAQPLASSLAGLEALHAQGTLPPLESLSLRLEVIDTHASWHALSRLSGLKELRLTDQLHTTGSTWMKNLTVSQSQLPAGSLLRFSKSMPLLETLALEFVAAPAGELHALQNWTQLRCLSLAGQKGLVCSDFAVLPKLTQLTELMLDGVGLPLIHRDWMRKIGKPVEGEEAEAKAEAAEAEPMDIESEGQAVPATAAASSSAASSSSPCLLTYLSRCLSLRLLRWRSSKETLAENEAYTADRSWFKVRSGKLSQTMQKRRAENERARERQALRTLLTARLDAGRLPLRVECFFAARMYDRTDTMFQLQLVPTQTQEADAMDAATDAAASSSSAAANAPSSSATGHLKVRSTETLAEEDATALSDEIEEEREWMEAAVALAAEAAEKLAKKGAKKVR